MRIRALLQFGVALADLHLVTGRVFPVVLLHLGMDEPCNIALVTAAISGFSAPPSRSCWLGPCCSSTALPTPAFIPGFSRSTMVRRVALRH